MRLALEQGRDDIIHAVHHEEFDFGIRAEIPLEQPGEIVFKAGKFIIAVDVIGGGVVVGDDHQLMALL
jgi:hypothetical protein